MANEIEKLFVSIGADVSELLTGLKESEKELGKLPPAVLKALKPLRDLDEEALKLLDSLSGGRKQAMSLAEALEVAGKSGKHSVKEIDEETQKLNEALKQLGKSGKYSVEEIKKPANDLNSTFNKLKAAAAAFIAIFAVGKVVNFFKHIGGAVIGTSSQFEVFTTQFETLLGSAEAAQQRISELAQFGVETPFELPEIVEASRQLEIFGGSVLSTGDNLRMIGDIAAGVNRPFADVAMWVGRMYDAMQSGRPFGEAAQSLQIMGAMSGVARAELEKMQKAGASGAELWAKFNELVGARFAGNTERLAQTFQGITSNLVDFRDNLLRIGGEAFFEEIKDSAKELLDIISETEMRAAIESLATAFGKLAATFTDIATSGILDILGDIDPKVMSDLAASFERAEAALNEFMQVSGDADSGINEFLRSIQILLDVFTLHTNQWNTFNDLLERFGVVGKETAGVLGFMQENLFKLLSPASAANAVFGEIAERLGMSNEALADATGRMAAASETQAQAADRAKKAAEEYAASLSATFGRGGAVDEVTEVLEENSTKIADLLDNLASEMIDLTEEREQRIAELEQDYQEKLIELAADYIDKRMELEQDYTEQRLELEQGLAKDLEELEQEMADRRSKVIANTRREIGKVEQETDKKLADEQADFNKEQQRDLEDHLARMREIREQYLVDVEDAVKTRDARALVDARRRYEDASSDEEENFATSQQREKEDFDQRLEDIRQAEQDRIDEILAAQDEELQSIADQEQKKKEELETGYQERMERLDADQAEKMAKLDAQYQEQLAKEDAQHAEQLAKLDAMLQERLAKIAKELADEKEIDEKGARAILQALDKTFGANGDIDKLMDDFVRRRRQKLIVKIEYETVTTGGSTSSTSTGGGASSTSSTSQNPQQIPTFQHGGSLLATKPTLAQFGEVPEMVTFTPLSQMDNNRQLDLNLNLNLSGSAPPGVRSADRDAIAGVVVNALREAGVMRSPTR